MKKIGSIITVFIATLLILVGIFASLGAQPASAISRNELLPAADASATQMNDFATCESDGGITTPDPEQASGAKYRICMPTVWNGNLLIYVHGYRFAHLPLVVPNDHICLAPGTCVHQIANQLGMAFAATSYSKNGLAVIPGVADAVELVALFEAEHGPAKNVYIAGPSEGGIVTTLAVERHPDIFDGGLSICGPTGDWNRQIQYFGNFRAVIDYYYPGMIAGDPTNVPQTYIDPANPTNNLEPNWETHYRDVVSPTLFAPANVYTLSQILIATDAQIGKHIDPTDWMNLDPQDPTIHIAVKDGLGYAIYATNEASEFLGGNPFDNTDFVYSGTDDDAALNAGVFRVSADMTATIAMQAYETDGNVQRPLVSLHTTRDQQVPYWHEELYQQKVLNNPDSQPQLFIDFPMPVDNYGHCILDVNAEMLPGFSKLLGMVNVPPQAEAVVRQDHVVASGADFATAFATAPISELVAYKYDGTTWMPIPFQIDQRTNDITGTFVLDDGDGGYMDINDELVFMSFDAGMEAPYYSWPSNAEAKANGNRMAVRVTDPLAPTKSGWIYLYHSTSLAHSSDTYLTWDAVAQTVTTISYTAKFGGADDEPAKFLGLADLKVNGSSIDMMDRQKILACLFDASCGTGLTEQDLPNLGITTTIDLPVSGPIRAVTNDSPALNVAVYPSFIEFFISFDLSGAGVAIGSIRTSFDMNDPAVTGVDNYYDANNLGGVAIDGSQDTIVKSPGAEWMQFSGDPGGFVLSIPFVEAGDPPATTLETYYNDSGSPCVVPYPWIADRGDGNCYGEAGLLINNPNSVIDFSVTASILPPNTTGPVGESYLERASNPLIGAERLESWMLTNQMYIPMVTK